MYVVLAALLLVRMGLLVFQPDCSIATVPRVRLLFVSVAWWAVVAFVALPHPAFDTALGVGAAVITVPWSVWMVRGPACVAPLRPGCTATPPPSLLPVPLPPPRTQAAPR